jgi:uncharacterized membrane protein YkoI
MTHRSLLFRPLLLASIAAVSIAAAPVMADDDDRRDQELARKALLEGRIRSLFEITEKVKPLLPGEILGVEIEVQDGGRIVYEFDVIEPGGKLKEVDVDAATAEILKIEDDD